MEIFEIAEMLGANMRVYYKHFLKIILMQYGLRIRI